MQQQEHGASHPAPRRSQHLSSTLGNSLSAFLEIVQWVCCAVVCFIYLFICLYAYQKGGKKGKMHGAENQVYYVSYLVESWEHWERSWGWGHHWSYRPQSGWRPLPVAAASGSCCTPDGGSGRFALRGANRKQEKQDFKKKNYTYSHMLPTLRHLVVEMMVSVNYLEVFDANFKCPHLNSRISQLLFFAHRFVPGKNPAYFH